MKQCRHYIVSGQVQGVFYRASTLETARQSKLTGWIQNLANGNVELVACGEADSLAALEAWLWRGPANAIVKAIQIDEVAQQTFSGFDVRYP
jgi:acylphosphatase